MILTGHGDGSIYQWEYGEDKCELENLKLNSAIICMVTYKQGIIFCTEDDSTIHLYDLTFKMNIKSIELRNFPFKLFSYVIADLIIANDKMLVSTKNGDIIEI